MIYFLQSGSEGPIKIGYTSNLSKQRKICCQTYQHEEVSLLADSPGDIQDEKRLHDLLSPYRIRGEWFVNCKEVIDVVRTVQSGVSVRDILY